MADFLKKRGVWYNFRSKNLFDWTFEEIRNLRDEEKPHPPEWVPDTVAEEKKELKHNEEYLAEKPFAEREKPHT